MPGIRCEGFSRGEQVKILVLSICLLIQPAIDKKYFDSPAPSASWPEGMSYQPVLLSSPIYSEEQSELRDEAWKRFGDQAPVLLDHNMFIDDPRIKNKPKTFRALVLLLDGSVHEVDWKVDDLAGVLDNLERVVKPKH